MKCAVGGQGWRQGNQVPKSGCPFPFALFPARALDQKIYSKQELHFQQKQKAIFPHYKGALLLFSGIFSREHLTCSLSAQEATLSLVTANEPENSLKRQDPTDRGLISFVCTCVLCIRNHYLSIDWGHSLLSFYYRPINLIIWLLQL